MVGALRLLELPAGPRCRMVLKAFDRLDAHPRPYPFCVEHAEADPVPATTGWTRRRAADCRAARLGFADGEGSLVALDDQRAHLRKPAQSAYRVTRPSGGTEANAPAFCVLARRAVVTDPVGAALTCKDRR